MAADRTEKPTHRRLQEARRKGQIARSRDLTQALQLGALIGGLALVGPFLLAMLGDAVRRGLVDAGEWAHRRLSIEEAAGVLTTWSLQFGLVVAPLAALSAIVVFGATAAQGGWVFSGEPLKLRWENLSPATGLKRLAPSRALVELGKTVLTAAAVAWICWGFARDLLAEADPMARMSALDAARVGWDATARMLARCAILLVLVAGADFLYQRWRFEQNLRMTKQEVRDDHRLSEGNPETKARVRRIQRELVRRRMLAAVPKATVVITNPDHFAVALEYRREVMLAPRVVAKGQDFLAEKIKAIAREHGVPVVENKPLARALYRSVDVGDTIPGDLFEAVAEVLAYLVRLKQVVL